MVYFYSGLPFYAVWLNILEKSYKQNGESQ